MAINGIGLSQGPPQNINPDYYAQLYANKNGISLEEAKQQLKSQFGNPKQHQVNSFQQILFSNNTDSIPSETIQLQTLGIPLNVILQGDNAIKQYADEYNINLPEKRRLDKNI